MHALPTQMRKERRGVREYSRLLAPQRRAERWCPTRKLAPQAVGARTSPGLDPGDVSWERNPGVVDPLASSPSGAALGQDEVAFPDHLPSLLSGPGARG